MALVFVDHESPFPEVCSNDEWTSYVAEGRDLVEQELRIQFSLGDLTLRMVSDSRGEGVDCGVFRVLSRYADEIGLSYSTLSGYRHMALAWPKEKRNPAVSFSIHRALDALEERFKLIFHPPEEIGEWTLDKALRYAKRRPHTPETQGERIDRVQALLRDEEAAAAAVVELVQRPQVVERVIADSRVRRLLLSDDNNAAEAVAEVLHRPKVAERLMADSEIRHSLLNNDDNAAAAVAEVVQRPKVAERVMDDSRSRSSLYRANMNRLTPSDQTAGRNADQQHGRAAGHEQSLVEGTRASKEVLEILGLGTAFITGLQDLIPTLHVAEYNQHAKRAIQENNRKVRATVDWCDTVMSTGNTSMDDQLAHLLHGDEES